MRHGPRTTRLGFDGHSHQDPVLGFLNQDPNPEIFLFVRRRGGGGHIVALYTCNRVVAEFLMGRFSSMILRGRVRLM